MRYDEAAMVRPRPPLAMVGLGVVSPFGHSADALADCLRAGRCGMPSPPPRNAERWPDAAAHWMHDFDAQASLGGKGISTTNRMTHLALLACREALAAQAPLDGRELQRSGIVLGSRGGSMQSIAEFVRSTYMGLPHMVSPMQFPNATMNGPAGHCAIRYGLQGVNTTICAGDLTGVAALQYAARMLRRGHADRLLAGAVEEYAPYNAWAHEADRTDHGLPYGEAAVMFSLAADTEAHDAPMHLLGARLGHAPGGRCDLPSLAEALRAEIEALLLEGGCRASDLAWAHASTWSGTAAVIAQHAALDGLQPGLADSARQLAPACPGAICHAHAAAAALDLAALLIHAPAGLGVLTAVGEGRQIGAVLVRKRRAFEVQ
jgi:3-oxoacyl-[acyl-carrier-protein] synthase II